MFSEAKSRGCKKSLRYKELHSHPLHYKFRLRGARGKTIFYTLRIVGSDRLDPRSENQSVFPNPKDTWDAFLLFQARFAFASFRS